MEEFNASEFIDQKYTVDEIDSIMDETLYLREAKKEASDKLKEINKALNTVEEKLVEALEENLKKNWELKGYKASVKVDKYPTMDKDPSKVKEFADYLQSIGGEDMVWSYFSVNHNTLRSFVKARLEENPEEVLPSIEIGFERKSIQMRKTK